MISGNIPNVSASSFKFDVTFPNPNIEAIPANPPPFELPDSGDKLTFTVYSLGKLNPIIIPIIAPIIIAL